MFQDVQLAKEFEQLVLSDPRFQVTNEVHGLVCFRLKVSELAISSMGGVCYTVAYLGFLKGGIFAGH